MRTRDDIEAYLSRSGHPHKEVAEDTWLVTDPCSLPPEATWSTCAMMYSG